MRFTKLKTNKTILTSGSQTVCRGTLVCRRACSGVLENILKILKICVFSENYSFFSEKPQLKHPKLKN